MNSDPLEKFLPLGPIAGREQMLREALTHRLLRWLEAGYYDVTALQGLRAVSDDIVGRTGTVKARPKDFDALHCVPFASLSPPNRKAAISAVLAFVGVGPDIYGAQGWSSIEAACAELCANTVTTEGGGQPPAEPELTPSEAPAQAQEIPWVASGESCLAADDWTLTTVAERVSAIFAGPNFYVTDVQDAHEALNDLRKRARIQRFDANREDPRWIGLRLLHCDPLRKIASDTRVGLLDAVFGVLALTGDDVDTLLGSERMSGVRGRLKSDFEASEPVVETGTPAPVAAETRTEQAELRMGPLRACFLSLQRLLRPGHQRPNSPAA